MFFFFGPFFLIVPLVAVFLATRFLGSLLRHVFRDTLRASPAIGTPPQVLAPGRLESRVVSLAYSLGGRVTVSDVVIETRLGMKEAEELLDGMTDEVRVRMTVDDDGLVAYEFPEIIERLKRERE